MNPRDNAVWAEVDRALDAMGVAPFSLINDMPTQEYPLEFIRQLAEGTR